MSYPRYRSQSVPAVEIDEPTKGKLRKHVQSKFQPEYLDLGKQRDAALNTAEDEDARQKAQRHYTEGVETLRLLADEEYQNLLRHEMAKRAGAERRGQPESVLQEQQRILDSIQRGDADHVTYRPGSTQPHSGRDHGARRPSITTANGATPEFWRPPSVKPEPSGLSRTLAHATARPPTAPPQMRRGSASGGLSGQTGVSVASEHARMRTPNPEHWNGYSRQRAPSDAHRAQSPATPTVSRAQAIPSSSHHRWNDHPRSSSTRPINTSARAEHVAFPVGTSPGARNGYPSPSSPGDVRQGIAIPSRGRYSGEDGGRSASYGNGSHLRNQSSSYRSYRHDVVRESPESDDELLEEDDDEEQSSGDFAHSLEIDEGASPEDRRRASEEQDRKLAERLQKEEMRAAQEERKRRHGQDQQQEDFRKREEQYYRRAVERNRQGSIDAGRNGISPSSWSNPAANGHTHHKPIVEDVPAPSTTPGPSRSRPQENAVAGPSGSSRSSRLTSESMARSIGAARTNVDECLDQMLSEMMELREEKLKLAGDDEDERDRVLDQHAAGLRSIYLILEQAQNQLQSELKAKRNILRDLCAEELLYDVREDRVFPFCHHPEDTNTCYI
ncbi:unnamed protein product [Peniophora sp. CBMAI 1063]|nr:unnamed protein product [Peniophora sp. CBMAI 1063]